MLNLSKTCKYGLKALAYLVRNGDAELVRIPVIAEAEKVPTNYLRKIFDRLIKARVVISTVGPGGGVQLAPGARRMSIADIIEILDGKPDANVCHIFGTAGCKHDRACPIETECRKLNREIWKKLRTFRLEGFTAKK
ncbi:MAG: Rrf2 family transcriptional regulator [Planctomycetes bacterium]|nr:Rrf2 family transcriptional regulator [Planctomycetota bacterium]